MMGGSVCSIKTWELDNRNVTKSFCNRLLSFEAIRGSKDPLSIVVIQR